MVSGWDGEGDGDSDGDRDGGETRSVRNAVRRLRLRTMPGGWWLDLALVVGLVVLTVLLVAKTPLVRWDVALAEWCDQHRPYGAELVARGLNRAGQGGLLAVISLGFAGWRAWRWHSVRPVLVVVAAYLLRDLVVGPIKLVTDRAAPHYSSIEHPEWLFQVSSAISYPSGHVANAIVWYTALAIVLGEALPRWLGWAFRVVPAPLIIVTTTYLGYHWLSDGLAGVLAGVVIARLLMRIDWNALPLGSWLERNDWARPVKLGVVSERVRAIPISRQSEGPLT